MNNTGSYGTINHEGIVQRNFGNSVLVRILARTACSGCHTEGGCKISKNEEKIVEIYGNYNVTEGDPVTILMKPSVGYAALFLGYILPLISVLLSLIIMISSGFSELIAGLVSISMLLPYYFILFLFKKRISEKFVFTLKI